MARTALKQDPWSPPAVTGMAGTPTLGLAVDSPVAELHRMIEARLRGQGLLVDADDRPTAVDALMRTASRGVGWAALVGSLVALAVLLL